MAKTKIILRLDDGIELNDSLKDVILAKAEDNDPKFAKEPEFEKRLISEDESYAKSFVERIEITQQAMNALLDSSASKETATPLKAHINEITEGYKKLIAEHAHNPNNSIAVYQQTLTNFLQHYQAILR